MKKQNQSITFEVIENEIAFRVGGKLIGVIAKDDFLTLLDKPVMEGRFRMAVPKNAEFEALDTTEGFARVSRLLRKGLSLEQAAQVLGVDAEALRKFWSYALPKYKGPQADAEIERQGHEQGDFCATVGLCETEGPEAGSPIPELFVDALAVHQNLAECGSVGQVADRMHLDHAALYEWLELNARVLEVLG